MTSFQSIILIMGVGLSLIALLQIAHWSAQSIGFLSKERKQYAQDRAQFNRQLTNAATAAKQSAKDGSHWKGHRHFRVAKLVKETTVCTSVYLEPEDGKPIPSFLPGQHLTFRFDIPGQPKPVVRCYSLSEGPNKPYYRISVKLCPPPRDRPELPNGEASSFVNHALAVGDQVEVKAPSGHFFLNEDSNKPVILLAGGIGVTPLISMLDHLIAQKSNRKIVFAYGSANSEDHVFKEYLETMNQQVANLFLVNFYTNPLPQDLAGEDYHLAGYVSPDTLHQLLSGDLDAEFYLCGPPPFMQSIFNGLLDFGVPEDAINFEAFGPASISKTKKEVPASDQVPEEVVPVKFCKSDVSANWDGSCETILELAESNGVEIDSGCRAGSCGTCSTELISGRVKYPDGQKPECEPGHCLVCIARPDGAVELGT